MLDYLTNLDTVIIENLYANIDLIEKGEWRYPFSVPASGLRRDFSFGFKPEIGVCLCYCLKPYEFRFKPVLIQFQDGQATVRTEFGFSRVTGIEKMDAVHRLGIGLVGVAEHH